MPRRIRLALVLAAALHAGGCAWAGSRMTTGVLQGAQQYVRHSPGRDTLQAMLDSIITYGGRSYERAGAARVDTALRQITAVAIDAADSVMTLGSLRTASLLTQTQLQLTDALRGPISDAVQQLIRESVHAGAMQGRADARMLSDGVGEDFDRVLAGRVELLVASTVASATDSLSVRLARQLAGGIRDGLIAVADTVARVGARAAVQAADDQARRGRLFPWMIAGTGFVVVALLVLAVALERARRRNRAALDVMADALRRPDLHELRQEIRHRASASNLDRVVETYLGRNASTPPQNR